MNPIQMSRRIDYHTDKSRSPRWYYDTNYMISLNVAMDNFINGRYDNIKEDQKKYAFETSQTLKDDLRTITKSVPLVPVNNTLILPVDYHHEVGLMVTINGIQVPSTPITHNEKAALYENQNTRPSPEYPVHYEDQTGITVLFGGYGTFSAAIMDYLRLPKEIVITADPTNRTQLLNINAALGVLTVGQEYYVTAAGTIHNAVTYNIGQTFIAVTVDLTAGSVSLIVSCELPEGVHEEICLMAASSLTGRAMNFQKNKLLDTELKEN